MPAKNHRHLSWPPETTRALERMRVRAREIRADLSDLTESADVRLAFLVAARAPATAWAAAIQDAASASDTGRDDLRDAARRVLDIAAAEALGRKVGGDVEENEETEAAVDTITVDKVRTRS